MTSRSRQAAARGGAARRGDAVAARGAADARRVLQLALAGLWLLDGVLQYQAFMFTKGFSQMLADTAGGQPGVSSPGRSPGTPAWSSTTWCC